MKVQMEIRLKLEFEQELDDGQAVEAILDELKQEVNDDPVGFMSDSEESGMEIEVLAVAAAEVK